MKAELQQCLSRQISKATSEDFCSTSCRPQGGGCINQAWLLSDSQRNYFAKLNSADTLSMFEAEALALEELASAKAIRVPAPVVFGKVGSQSYLVLEALHFGQAKHNSWEAMGQQLALLHRKTAKQFGWHRDNTIGSTPQRNQWTDDWPTFFREHRLRPQFELAWRNGYSFKNKEKLLEQIEDLLAGHSPAPSLLHGDLWSGNAGFLDNGTPVIYDPATYYGDRETDLAFSEFFGGFPGSFYQAYQNEWPLPPGYEQRKSLYNLYHVLNHANLFGGGYATQAESMIERLLGS